MRRIVPLPKLGTAEAETEEMNPFQIQTYKGQRS